MLENAVFLELKRRDKDIYYHSDRKECDFLVRRGEKIDEAIQVTYDLNEYTKEREIGGLVEALNKFNLKEGLIITFDQEDFLIVDKKRIKVIPAWKWLIE